MSDPINCTDQDNRVLISISVEDSDGNEVTGIDYRSPRGDRGFAVSAMLADVTLLSGAWTKALAAHCEIGAEGVIASVSGEASD